MITPTIGRVIHVHNRPGTTDSEQPEAASVAYVWSDRLINVGGFDHNGRIFACTSLDLLQDDDAPPAGAYATWMPFQKGQAAKTEALEEATKKDTVVAE